jgi:phenylpyruvate tautomerase PptA (4-oxalocrotonate tautomerase family)
MPFVQIHTAREISADKIARAGVALANAYARCMQTNSRIVNVGFSRYEAGSLARFDAEGGPKEMLILTCDVRRGRSPDILEAFGKELTALCAREFGIGEAQVAVYITEHDTHEIYRDGGRAPHWSEAESRIDA